MVNGQHVMKNNLLIIQNSSVYMQLMIVFEDRRRGT